jgi:RNase adapter protein RapZ
MIRIVSFGYKHRKPPKALAVFDCRDLRNPHNMPELKALTGLDKLVSDYVRASPAFELLVHYAISHRGLDEFTLAFGCLGGRHRSVATAEEVGDRLRKMSYEVEVIHSELG